MFMFMFVQFQKCTTFMTNKLSSVLFVNPARLGPSPACLETGCVIMMN